MGFFSFIKKAPPASKKLEGSAKTFLISSSGKEIELKPGKWVVCPEGIGILTVLHNSQAQVDLVMEDGVTSHSSIYGVGQLRIATVKDIPECRRPISDTQARELGYL